MKIILAFLIAGVAVGQALALTIQEAMQQGLRSMQAGDYAAARANFELVLKHDPKHPTARALLRQAEIAAQEPVMASSKLQGVKLPGVNFKEASLNSVFKYLVDATSAASDGKVTLNIVPELSQEELKSRRITLNLAGNVPLMEVLRYVGRLGNVEFRSDPHALIVIDKHKATAEPAAEPASGLGN